MCIQGQPLIFPFIHFILGLLDKKSRLKLLRSLDLSGTEISDVGLRYVTQYLGQLTRLSVAKCWKISDAGLAQLSTLEALTSLDCSGSKMITNQGLAHLGKCKSLVHLDCTNTSVTTEGLKRLVEDIGDKRLKVSGHVIVAKRQSSRR